MDSSDCFPFKSFKICIENKIRFTTDLKCICLEFYNFNKSNIRNNLNITKIHYDTYML